MSYAEMFSKNILQSKGMIDLFLKDFSDAEMLFRPAKTANHAIWQMGHLANSVRGMVTTCDPSVAFPFEDDTRFGKSKASIDDPAFFPGQSGTSRQIRSGDGHRSRVGGETQRRGTGQANTRTHASIRADGWSAAILLASHPFMHIGQFTVMRRALGKPILF